MVHRRSIGGEPVVFGNQGALFGNAMTWWDHDTGSIWSQPRGVAIMGPRRGETLELLPSALTSWKSWRELHPDTLALDAPDGNIGRTLDDLMIVVELRGDVVAFPMPKLRAAEVVNTRVGGVPIAVVAPQDSDQWAVFARVVGGGETEMRVSSGSLVAADDPSREWNSATGLALDGGDALATIPAFTVFPRDYPTFFPGGGVWDPGAESAE